MMVYVTVCGNCGYTIWHPDYRLFHQKKLCLVALGKEKKGG